MKDALKVYGPIAAIALLLLIIAMRLVAPPPPKTISFAAGGADGQYYALATRYADALSEHGIKVDVLETAGTVENYKLLLDGTADVALLQGGIAGQVEREQVDSLGGVLAEPFWIFMRSDTLSNLSRDFGDLNSVRIAGGPIGSGTRAMAERLQEEWGGDWQEIIPLSGQKAADALLAGDVEAVVYTASVEAGYVQRLMANPQTRLIGMRRANGLSMRDAALAPVTLFEGVVSMNQNIPSVDVPLVAAIAQLGVRNDLHPAIQSVLLESQQKPAGFTAKAQRFSGAISALAGRTFWSVPGSF